MDPPPAPAVAPQLKPEETLPATRIVQTHEAEAQHLDREEGIKAPARIPEVPREELPPRPPQRMSRAEATRREERRSPESAPEPPRGQPDDELTRRLRALEMEVDRLRGERQRNEARGRTLADLGRNARSMREAMLRDVGTYLQRSSEQGRWLAEEARRLKGEMEGQLAATRRLIEDLEMLATGAHHDVEQATALERLVEDLQTGQPPSRAPMLDATVSRGSGDTRARSMADEVGDELTQAMEAVAEWDEDDDSPKVFRREQNGVQAHREPGADEAAQGGGQSSRMFSVTVVPTVEGQQLARIWAALEGVVGKDRVVASEPLRDGKGLRLTLESPTAPVGLGQLSAALPEMTVEGGDGGDYLVRLRA
ncbi:MAG: hypothetical protein FJ315_05445 [SAR202 cluster bacterium]|nr:hypothetical protein [SAR202 cluster bacterium]